ncbi:hypothetical protein ACF0H5_020859 [Mactra antiquata]
MAVYSQLLMEELNNFKIDPMTLNGTQAFTKLTIDQLIMQAMGGPGVAQNLVLSEDGFFLAELDMVLTKSQFFNLYEKPQNMMLEQVPPRNRRKAFRKMMKEARRHKRKAIRSAILRWDEAVVPYRFVSGHFQDKELYMINSAMTEWERYTCLSFRPSNRNDRNIVRFQNGLGCNSQLGMVGGEQALNLDKNGCRYKGLYLHEIGHAVGLVHEHQLPNRDDYIEILTQNVQPNMRIWFNKYSAQEVDQMNVPYEYSSVMHYGITAFSHDGKSQTIRAKQEAKEESIGRVYKKELSFTDVKIVNLMYHCADHCDKSIECYNGGFVDQNCKCICPDGTDSCTKNDVTPVDVTCFNAHDDWQCNVWANQGECERNPKYMLDGCRKACHKCGKEETKDDTCKDMFSTKKCEVWKEKGECIVNKVWMEKNCKATCKACTSSGHNPDVDCTNDYEDDAECDKWATEGECQMNPNWMPKNCRKACHMCGKDLTPVTTQEPTTVPGLCRDEHNEVECKGWADSGECDINPDWMIPNCRKSCNKCSGGGGRERECKNTWDDAQCEGWAKDMECVKNEGWMHANCHKACTKCTSDGTVTERPIVTTKPTRPDTGSKDCVNNHKSDHDCETWANYGHCSINEWMIRHCAKACSSCEEAKTTTAKPDTSGKEKGNDSPTCVDSQKHCPAWALHGFCADNPGTALRICKKSCNACSKSSNGVCSDENELCAIWSSGGQCNRNSGYMLRHCQKSCGVC